MSRKVLFILVSLAAILALTVTIAFVKRDAITYRINDSRATSLLADSIEAGKSGDWKRADQLAQSAWQLRNGDLEVLRQWYRASLHQQSRYLLVTARALFEHPEASAVDRKEILQLHLNIGDLVTFKRFLLSLPEDEKKDPDLMAMAVRYYLARNELRNAVKLVDSLNNVRGAPIDQLLAAEVLSRISSNSEEAGVEAQKLIDILFKNKEKPNIALAAFSLLRKIPDTQRNVESFADSTSRLDDLEATATVPTELRLLALELEASQNSELKDRLIDTAINRFLESDPAPLAAWLIARGEAKILIQILPEERTRESIALFQPLVQAQMMMGNLDDADRLLANAPTNMKPWIVLGLRGTIATAKKERAASQSFWARAYDQAKSAQGREALVELARVAARAGNETIRNRALTEALKRPSAIAMPLADVAFLFSVYTENENTEDLLEVSRNLLTGQPDNPLLINNVLWLELISDRVRQDLTKEMESNVEKFPKLLALRSTLALAQVNNDKSDQALSTLDPILKAIEGDSGEIGDTDRAVMALALLRAGEAERSRKIASTITWTNMLELERDFFRGELAAVSSDSPETTISK